MWHSCLYEKLLLRYFKFYCEISILLCFCKKVKPPYYFYNSRSGNKAWETRRWQGNIKKMVACTNTKILKHFSYSTKTVTKIIYCLQSLYWLLENCKNSHARQCFYSGVQEAPGIISKHNWQHYDKILSLFRIHNF